MTHKFQITFKGVRGSIPAPLTSSLVEEKLIKALQLAKPEDLARKASIKKFVDSLPIHIKGCFGGNSSCVLAEVGDERLIFDAGSGLRELGRDWMKSKFAEGKGKAHIFLSHTHLDHIMGIPFFEPFYVAGNQFTFYAVHQDIKERLVQQQNPKYFPVSFKTFRADIDFVQLNERKKLKIGDADISWKTNYHPGKSFAFRVDYRGKSFIYATDAEYRRNTPDALKPTIRFFRDVDLLVFDSQYTFAEETEQKKDWGHSSTVVGIDIALAAHVKQIAFYHHEPTYSDFKLIDILQQSRNYLKSINSRSTMKMFFAHEGLTVDLMNP
ncbi:MAG: MBL fold metallo-hydrolase [Nitrospinales bacterium]